MNPAHFKEGPISFTDMCGLLQELGTFGFDFLTLRVVAARDQGELWFPYASSLKNDSDQLNSPVMTRVGQVALVSVCGAMGDIKKVDDLKAFLGSWKEPLDGQFVVPGYAEQFHLYREGSYSVFGRYPCWQGTLPEVTPSSMPIMTPRGPFFSPDSGILKHTIGELAAWWTGIPAYHGGVQPARATHIVISDPRAHFTSGHHSGLQIEIEATALPTVQSELYCCVSVKDFDGAPHTLYEPVKEGRAIFTLPAQCREIELLLSNSEGYCFDRLVESEHFCNTPFSLLGLFHRSRDVRPEDLRQALDTGEGEHIEFKEMTESPSHHDYDIIELLAQFKDGIRDAVTENKGLLEDNEYKSTRRLIMGHPVLRGLAPGWLHSATTLQSVRIEVGSLAGHESGKWDRAREIVATGLTPMLDALLANEIATNLNLERHERLGGGGFGEVYRYHDNLIGVDFAVKILNPAFAGDGDRSFDRFLREARILFQMNHLNVVRVYEVGVTLGDRRPFITMELVDGETLATSGSLAEQEANHIALQVARALAHAHEKGVLHRDVKPSNIMVSPSGRVVLLDFGLGVFVEGDIVSRITKTGEAAAGGRYTAPELEANPKLLDPKTDIFSLGAVWFTMLCGQPPAGVKVETMLRDSASISDGVAELVLKCLAPLPAERPTANDIIYELEKSRSAPSQAPAVRHIGEELEKEIEGEWAAFWRDTV